MDQAQASDQFLATNKEICLKTKKIYKRNVLLKISSDQ